MRTSPLALAALLLVAPSLASAQTADPAGELHELDLLTSRAQGILDGGGTVDPPTLARIDQLSSDLAARAQALDGTVRRQAWRAIGETVGGAVAFAGGAITSWGGGWVIMAGGVALFADGWRMGNHLKASRLDQARFEYAAEVGRTVISLARLQREHEAQSHIVIHLVTVPANRPGPAGTNSPRSAETSGGAAQTSHPQGPGVGVTR